MNYFTGYSFIEQDMTARTLSFYCKERLSYIDEGVLNELKRIAIEEKQEVRVSMHNSQESDIHNMIICQHNKSYVRPHKHMAKSETIHIIAGSLLILIFSESGDVIKRVDMNSNRNLIFRTEENIYHAYIPTTEYVIYHESKRGPFIRQSDSIYPSWAINIQEKDHLKDFIDHVILKTSRNNL